LFDGFLAGEIAGVCCCSVQTAYHWKSGIRVPSARALKLWKLHRDGQVLTKEFRGFCVRGGELIDPQGQSLTRANIESYQFFLSLSRDYARRLGPAEYDRWWELFQHGSKVA
jgi:hypothetical protein